jgi:hypothetical protein
MPRRHGVLIAANIPRSCVEVIRSEPTVAPQAHARRLTLIRGVHAAA